MMEMLRPLLTSGLTVLVQIIILIVGTYVVKYLTKAKEALQVKIGAGQFAKMQAVAKMVTLAIEQQYPNMAGNRKYESAMAALNEKLGNVLTQKELNDLIEAAVCEMNLIKKGDKPKTITIDDPILNQDAAIR